MARVGYVYYDGAFAGTLSEERGHYTFTYDDTYVAIGVPLSYTLPLRKQPFFSDRLPAFFENLVSEGWLRQQQSIQQKIDERDKFGLLLANGQDLIGAVCVLTQQSAVDQPLSK